MQRRPPRLDIRHLGILISLPIALTAGDWAMSDSGSDRRTAPGTGAPSTRATSVGTPSPALFQAAGDIVVRVETSGIFALQGETVSLSIGLALANASAPAAAYSVAVNWSPAELAFVNVTAGNFSTGLGSFTPDLTDTFTGYVEVTANEPTGVKDGAFTLYNVNLTVDEAVARGSVLDVFVNVFQLDGPSGENLLPEMRLGTGMGQICLANYVFGDVTQNGAVTAGDVVQILRSLVGLPLSAGVDLGLADVTGDGLATTSDAVEILRGIVGLAVPAGSQFGKAAVSGCPTPSPSAATSLITATPTTIMADGISTSEITVTVLDDFGNDLVFGGDAVALSTTAGTLSPVTDNGTGTYTATLTSLTVATTATVTGTVNGSPMADTEVVTFAVNHLSFTLLPTTATAGIAIAPAIEVSIFDEFGVIDPTATEPVTITIGANPGGGTLSGTTTVSAVGGMATFADLSIDKAGSGYTLDATAPVIQGTASATFDITTGPAAKLAFTVEPSNTQAGNTILPAVEVSVQDAFGNLVSTATDPVTLAIDINAGGGTLSGTNIVSAVGGVATFGNLSIDKTGSGYTLSASATGLTGATSSAFDIMPAAITGRLETAAPDNGLAVDGSGIFVDLTATSGNLVVTEIGMVSSASAGTPIRLRVWRRVGTYVGFDDASIGWSVVDQVDATSAGTTNPTTFILNNPINLTQGQVTGFLFEGEIGGVRYTGIGVSTPQTTWTDVNLTLFSDRSRTAPFGGDVFTPRNFSGYIQY